MIKIVTPIQISLECTKLIELLMARLLLLTLVHLKLQTKSVKKKRMRYLVQVFAIPLRKLHGDMLIHIWESNIFGLAILNSIEHIVQHHIAFNGMV